MVEAAAQSAAPEAPSYNPNRILNDGKGVSVAQAAEAFDLVGLVDQLDEIEQTSPRGGRRSADPGSREEAAELTAAAEELGLHEQGSTPPAADGEPRASWQPQGAQPAQYTPMQHGPQVPPQVQQAVGELQGLGQAYSQIVVALDSLSANRQQLVAQFGAPAVLAEEQKLRFQLDQVNRAGARTRQGLDQFAQQHQHQQARLAQQEMESRNARFRREFQTDAAGLADLARESIEWAVDQGIPRDRVMSCSEDEGRLLMQAALDRRAAQQARQAAERAAQQVKRARALARARPDHDKLIYSAHGSYRQGDGSLANATAEFLKLKVF
jgi:hypothetical protein